MFSYAERLKAVKFYIKSGYRLRYSLRCLGYPSSRVTLKQWHQEYVKNNQSLHASYKTDKRHHSIKYTKEQIGSFIEKDPAIRNKGSVDIFSGSFNFQTVNP